MKSTATGWHNEKRPVRHSRLSRARLSLDSLRHLQNVSAIGSSTTVVPVRACVLHSGKYSIESRGSGCGHCLTATFQLARTRYPLHAEPQSFRVAPLNQTQLSVDHGTTAPFKG